MSFDSVQFPRARAYVDRLPQGLGSYPQARIHRDLIAPVTPSLAEVGEALPPVLAELVDGRNQDEWVPEVWAAALHLVARDALFDTDQAVYDWTRRTNTTVVQGPVGRMVLRTADPREWVAQFARRWAHYHRGTFMGVSQVERTDREEWVPVVLQYPTHLWNEFLLRRGAIAFETMLAASNAEVPRVTLEHATPDEAWYRCAWTPR